MMIFLYISLFLWMWKEFELETKCVSICDFFSFGRIVRVRLEVLFIEYLKVYTIFKFMGRNLTWLNQLLHSYTEAQLVAY